MNLGPFFLVSNQPRPSTHLFRNIPQFSPPQNPPPGIIFGLGMSGSFRLASYNQQDFHRNRGFCTVLIHIHRHPSSPPPWSLASSSSVMRYNLIILAVDRCFSIHSIQLQPSSGHLPGRSGVKKCGALQTTNQSTTFLDQIDLDGKHLLQLSITKTASTCFHHQRSVHRLFQAPELVSTRHHRWIRSG